MLGRGLNLLLGAQAGGEGKGKIAAWLADTEEVDVSVCDFTPKVSYSATLHGEEYATSQVPMAAAVRASKGAPLPSLAILLPTAVIDPHQLLAEVVQYSLQDRLMIDSRCKTIDDRRASDIPMLSRWVVNDVTKTVRQLAAEGKRILFEMGHGFNQSLSFGDLPDAVSARDNTVGAALNSAGCPAQLLAEVIAVVRAKEFDGTLGRTLSRCWRINKPSQAVVNFLDSVNDVDAFIREAQLNIATDTLWLSGSPDADSIQRW